MGQMRGDRLLGRRVYRLRELRGMSQRELARSVGIRQAFVSQIEHGVRRPSTETLRAIADALRVPAGELLSADVVPVEASALVADLSGLAPDQRAAIGQLIRSLRGGQAGPLTLRGWESAPRLVQ